MSFLENELFDVLFPQTAESDLAARIIMTGYALLIAIVVFMGFLFAGERQRAGARGPRWRVFRVACGATVLTLLPVITTLVYSRVTAITPTETVILVAGLLSVIAGGRVAAFFKPLGRSTIDGFPTPTIPVDDELFLNRVRELADRMRLPMPAVHLLRSPSADQQAMGYVVGLPAPTILVTDGLISRLDEDERDAIVCHELAHIANGSLWFIMALMPLAASAGMIAFLSGVTTWFLVIPVMLVGLYRFLMRPAELDCDLRAARAMGFPETATALRKVHRLGLESHTCGWLLKLIYATTTHPSLAARLACLRRHASGDDLPRLPDSSVKSSLAWLAAGTWLACVGVGWWLGRLNSWPALIASGALLLVATITPWLLLQASLPAAVLRYKFLGYWRQNGWLNVGLAVAAVVIFVAWRQLARMSEFPLTHSAMSPLLSIPIMLGLAALALLMIRKSQQNTAHRAMLAAWSQHDFELVLSVSRRYARIVAKDVGLRHLRAGSLAILGNRPQAIVEFEELIASDPKYEPHYIALASVLIDDGTPEKVLPLAELVLERFPSGNGHALASRALRRLGRLDEAQLHLESVLTMQPENGSVWGAAAGIAMDRGDYVKARKLLKIAEEKTPGTPQSIIESARLASRTEPPEQAAEKLNRAIAHIQNNPMLMRQSDLALMQKELGELTTRIAASSCHS